MSDLSETPAVPPEPVGGNERVGLQVAGSLLLLLGVGGGVVLNLFLHAIAGPSGLKVGPWWIGPSLGWFGGTVLGLGVFAGAIGGALWALSFRTPRGPLHLPGYPY
jgi:hypothetical protein